MENVFHKKVLYYGKFSLRRFCIMENAFVRGFCIMENIFHKRVLYYRKHFS